jgi:signal transduction histidine kinase
MNETIHILLVEDDKAYAKFLEHTLSSGQWIYQIEHVEYLHHALEKLTRQTYDVILLDLFLPDSQGLGSIPKLHAETALTPLIVLTSLNDRDIGMEAVSRGAQDFIIKSELTEEILTKSIHYAIKRKSLEKIKSEFVGFVTHELNTPLTIIREGISRVLEGVLGDVNENQRKFLHTSLNNVDRLGHIVDDLMDVTKLEFQKIHLDQSVFNMVELAKELSNAFYPVIKRKGLELREHYASHEIKVRADRERIVQVINNLMMNAIKFTKEGFIELAVIEQDGQAMCSVTDSGVGITPDHLRKVFQKFEHFDSPQLLKDKGTGLGLYICKGLIDLHEGKVGIESEVNKGTKVFFTLPTVSHILAK